MKSTRDAQLINFLRGELAIPTAAIAIALRQSDRDTSQLPIILWQYGLVSLEQLDRIFDWLATVSS
ncbi:DUF2949 domain-containing protein [Kamptonema sp. UHCC 0994]|uniref:DUF2949 domain-containing protein n=1 Tax=Kamptonema sp. UHCC 0994 TaxID=3031329 RepID=UPI0023B8A43A|nr:DUF2949 domain-containing protein [Kamptonema sp. UHCC 0994]MDF0553102.1 DUF2949 domain-containing protein [Kamptonema sp. UHCC 0994]